MLTDVGRMQVPSCGCVVAQWCSHIEQRTSAAAFCAFSSAFVLASSARAASSSRLAAASTPLARSSARFASCCAWTFSRSAVASLSLQTWVLLLHVSDLRSCARTASQEGACLTSGLNAESASLTQPVLLDGLFEAACNHKGHTG